MMETPHPTVPVPSIPLADVFWYERLEAMDHPIHPADIRFNGHLYVISPNDLPPRARTVDIRWYTGEHLLTARLRWVSEIPVGMRTKLPDNAIVTLVD